jgi:hypothetical protein
MKSNILVRLSRRIRSFTRRHGCAQFLFFGSCAEVPTTLKQSLADPGHSVSDVEGHYDIDGMSYNCDEGVIAAADPRPILVLEKNVPAHAR